MMRFILNTAIFLVATSSFAVPPPQGRVMCEGDACQDRDIPTGSATGFDDYGIPHTEIKKRLDISVSAINKDDQKQSTKSHHAKQKKKTDGVKSSKKVVATNLPQYYQGINRAGVQSSDLVVFVPKSSDPRLKGLRSGDIVWAVVEQEITASPSVPSPIRAIAISGQFKGAYFVGEATLDRELKRVLFSFSKLRLRDQDTVYALRAQGLSPKGSIGLTGDYHSQTGKFFIAELAAAGAAGYLDATINRNQTSFGTYVQEPSIANSGKTAAVSALSKTADRSAEAARSAPEYTQVDGYQEIQVIIQDDPVETGS